MKVQKLTESKLKYYKLQHEYLMMSKQMIIKEHELKEMNISIKINELEFLIDSEEMGDDNE